MIKKTDYFSTYLSLAPLPLAIERYWECEIQASKMFEKPTLDVGCGEGIFANVLFDSTIDLGIDPNELELMRAKVYQKYDELISCRGDDIPKPDESFKTIFSNSVLEHIPDIQSTLNEMQRLLKTDGKIYLTLPTDNFEKYTMGYQVLSFIGINSWKQKYQKRFNAFWVHYHSYNQKKWEALFEQSGLKVKECYEYGSKAQCMFNSMASPLCIFALLVKKMTNHWFLFPSLRRWVAQRIYKPLFSRFAELNVQPQDKGGLIFFVLEKS